MYIYHWLFLQTSIYAVLFCKILNRLHNHEITFHSTSCQIYLNRWTLFIIRNCFVSYAQLSYTDKKFMYYIFCLLGSALPLLSPVIINYFFIYLNMYAFNKCLILSMTQWFVSMIPELGKQRQGIRNSRLITAVKQV